MKAWITKYALTSGIWMVDGKVCHDISDTMLEYRKSECTQYAHGKDWHRTPAAAIARAEEMRKKKISSLRKSIAKLESLEF